MSIAAMKMALEALEELENTNSHWWQEIRESTMQKMDSAIHTLRQAIEQAQPAGQDWSLLEATQESLREHMAEIKRLRGLLEQAEQAQPVEPPSNKYNEKRIAWELERTAMGDDYYGNALYVAMDMAQTTQADREMLHRYMHGSNLKTDHVKLQDLAMRIYTAPPPRQPWVGLTDEDVMSIAFNFDLSSLSLVAKAIKAKLKEKNT